MGIERALPREGGFGGFLGRGGGISSPLLEETVGVTAGELKSGSGGKGQGGRRGGVRVAVELVGGSLNREVEVAVDRVPLKLKLLLLVEASPPLREGRSGRSGSGGGVWGIRDIVETFC